MADRLPTPDEFRVSWDTAGGAVLVCPACYHDVPIGYDDDTVAGARVLAQRHLAEAHTVVLDGEILPDRPKEPS